MVSIKRKELPVFSEEDIERTRKTLRSQGKFDDLIVFNRKIVQARRSSLLKRVHEEV